MHVLRREFGLLAATSLVLTAIPFNAFADPDDDVTPSDKDKDHHEVHASGSKHHSGATTVVLLGMWWTMRHTLIPRRIGGEKLRLLMRFGLPTVPAETAVTGPSGVWNSGGALVAR